MPYHWKGEVGHRCLNKMIIQKDIYSSVECLRGWWLSKHFRGFSNLPRGKFLAEHQKNNVFIDKSFFFCLLDLIYSYVLFSQEPTGRQREEYNVFSDDIAFQCSSYQKPIIIIHKSPQDVPRLAGYHDNQSTSAPADALHPVAQRRLAFHTWEYWESVWDDREWWQDTSAVQTWMDVESILSARGVRGKRPSIRRQGSVSKNKQTKNN